MNTELQFLLYDDPSENSNINVVIKDDTIWATQKTIAELYDVHPSSVTRHLGNIYEEKELEEFTTTAKFAIVVNRGFRGAVKEDMIFYNLHLRGVSGKFAQGYAVPPVGYAHAQ